MTDVHGKVAAHSRRKVEDPGRLWSVTRDAPLSLARHTTLSRRLQNVRLQNVRTMVDDRAASWMLEHT